MYGDTAKSTRIQRLFQWVRAHKKLVIIVVSLVLVVAVSLVAFLLSRPEPAKEPAPAPQSAPEPAPVVYYSPLTGKKVADEAATTKPVTAIMIENSPAARPQSGLKEAGVVYEAVAEGGVTRFLALYQESKPQLIGPVRSLRMYYVDWLAPYNASVAHVGGSADALREVRNGKYRDIDQFFNGGSYWRSTDRYAPHNVYTNFKNIDALNKAKGYTSSTFTGFNRTEAKPSEQPGATSITINFSGPTYNTRYTYDKKTNRYLRSMDGKSHVDREKGRLSPDVVIAMHVDMKHVMQDGYRERITTTGSGKATIFQNGTAKNVTWRKANRNAQLKFTDKNGEDVPLMRGQTWIAAVPNNQGSVSWQ